MTLSLVSVCLDILGWMWMVDSLVVAVLVAVVLAATFKGIYLNGENILVDFLRFTLGLAFVWKCCVVLAGLVYR